MSEQVSPFCPSNGDHHKSGWSIVASSSTSFCHGQLPVATFLIHQLISSFQNERAFQKQPTVPGYRKPKVGAGGALLTKDSKRVERYHKSVGLGFKTPKGVSWIFGWFDQRWSLCSFQAIKGKYIDKKCPFTGGVSIRGRILRGVVIKTKMQRTIVIRRDYLHYVKKYNRFEKRHMNMSVHCSPCFR